MTAGMVVDRSRVVESAKVVGLCNDAMAAQLGQLAQEFDGHHVRVTFQRITEKEAQKEMYDKEGQG